MEIRYRANPLPEDVQKQNGFYRSEIESEGARFENLIASHLLKFCNFYHFVFGVKASLWYLRDRQGREVDFLVHLGRDSLVYGGV